MKTKEIHSVDSDRVNIRVEALHGNLARVE